MYAFVEEVEPGAWEIIQENEPGEAIATVFTSHHDAKIMCDALNKEKTK